MCKITINEYIYIYILWERQTEKWVCMHVCVYVCVCVRERDRERLLQSTDTNIYIYRERERVRERQRERERIAMWNIYACIHIHVYIYYNNQVVLILRNSRTFSRHPSQQSIALLRSSWLQRLSSKTRWKNETELMFF